MAQQNLIYLSATKRDEDTARILQEGFERFHVPAGVVVHPDRVRFARARTMLWLNEENHRVGEIPEAVQERIRACEMLVLLCSASAASSRWIAGELDVYYRGRPRGIVIPVILEGVPHPDESQSAYEKPCFPDNLRKADQDRWIGARGIGGPEAAVAGVLAAVLGVRVEELVYHIDRRATGLARERTIACTAGAAAVALATIWTFRESVHQGALDGNEGYAGGWGRDVESFLAQFRMEGVGMYPPDVLQPTSALPPPGPQPLASAVESGAKNSAFLSGLEGQPEALKLAIKAWLDRAETHLPNEPDQARAWLLQCEELLSSASPGEYGNELYRFHALLAVAARCHGDGETAKAELARAVGFWTQMPMEDAVAREDEAFEILATISPEPDWAGSVQLLVEWLSAQNASGERLMKRAARLQEFAAIRPALIPLVDAFLARAVDHMDPPAADLLAERARWDLNRAEFASSTGRTERSSAILTAGLMNLEREGQIGSGLHRCLKAQIVFREGKDRSETRPLMLLETIPILEEGCMIAGWQDWFTADVAAAWSLTGDLQLESGEPGMAIKSYNRAVEYADSPETLAHLLLRSGCAYRYAGDPGGAWDAFSLALPIFEQAGNQPSQVVALYGQALAAKDLDRPDDAAKLATRAAALRQRLGAGWKAPIYWREPLDDAALTAAALPDVAVESLDYNPVIEAKISKVRREIESREKAGADKHSAEELQELQALYEELDRLLREKITGSTGSSGESLEVEVLRRNR